MRGARPVGLRGQAGDARKATRRQGGKWGRRRCDNPSDAGMAVWGGGAQSFEGWSSLSPATPSLGPMGLEGAAPPCRQPRIFGGLSGLGQRGWSPSPLEASPAFPWAPSLISTDNWAPPPPLPPLPPQGFGHSLDSTSGDPSGDAPAAASSWPPWVEAPLPGCGPHGAPWPSHRFPSGRDPTSGCWDLPQWLLPLGPLQVALSHSGPPGARPSCPPRYRASPTCPQRGGR